MLSLAQDVNTHLNPNPSMISEKTTNQMADSPLQWPPHLPAIQVRNCGWALCFCEAQNKDNVFTMKTLRADHDKTKIKISSLSWR